MDPKSIPVRWSNLSMMGRSPAHYRHGIETERGDTLAMRLGRLVHQIILGGEPFTVYDGTRRGKEWEAFRSAHDGEEIVTATEAERANGMAAAVLANEDAAQALTGEGGWKERGFKWEIAGRKCSGRPDTYYLDSIVELKTTVDSSPRRFPYQARQMAYPAQLAWYADGLRVAELADPQRYSIVAVESKAPYVVTLYELTPQAVEIGRRTYRLWWEQLRICEESGEWPGYQQGFVPLDVADEDFALTVDGEEII